MNIRKQGTNRIVEIYTDEVYKIPMNYEAVLHNRTEANIWGRTKHHYLCSCELKDGIFLYMEKVEDVSKGVHGYTENWLPNDFKDLLKKHPQIEYGVKNGLPKIYDYADCVLNWDLNEPEDQFINDLKLCT